MTKEQIEKLREEMSTIVENNADNFFKEFQEMAESITNSENTTDVIANIASKTSSIMYANLSHQMLSLFDALLDTLENNE